VTRYPCLAHLASASREHWVIADPGSRPGRLREADGRHAICSTEGMPKMSRDPASSLAFVARAIVPSASDGVLTAWSLIGLLLVVATLLIGAR
jgi:hypothetical protein